jgi:uncharacterized protein YbaR (Trm112 family)
LVSETLLEILWCPVCHGDLVENEAASSLDCTACGRSYPVKDGIPDMVPEGTTPEDGGDG